MDQDWLPYDLKRQRRMMRSKRNQHRVKGWFPTMVFGAWGVVSIGIGCMEMSSGQMTQLVCRRSTNQSINIQVVDCTRTITTGLIREAPIEIRDVEKARVQHVGRKFRNAYRVVLVTRSGEFAVTEDFKSNQQEKIAHSQNLNDFIYESAEPSFGLQEDDRAQSNLFGLMFIAIGSLWLLMAIVLQIAVNRKTILVHRPLHRS